MGDGGGAGVKVNLAVRAELELLRGVDDRDILLEGLGPPRRTLFTDVR